MVKIKKLIYDVRTGKQEIKEEEVKEVIEPAKQEEISINLKELKQLLDYAKRQGWIKA